MSRYSTKKARALKRRIRRKVKSGFESVICWGVIVLVVLAIGFIF